MEIRHIVFDIGNVLIGWNSELAFLEQIPNEKERSWFLDNVCTMEWNIEQDRGRSWVEAEGLLIEKFPEHEENIRTFRANWPAMVSGEIPGSSKILKSLLADGHDVTMLTNFAADTFEIAKANYQFLESSRGITVSADVGLIKPDIEIYHHHVREFGLSPAHSVFIDDSVKNIEGAIAAGWQGIHFTDAPALRKELARRGVPV